MTEESRPAPKKRRRPALACAQCRARKVRCDRTSPCSNCIKFGIVDCRYSSSPRVQAIGSALASEPVGTTQVRNTTNEPPMPSRESQALAERQSRPREELLHQSHPSSRYHEAIEESQPFLTSSAEYFNRRNRHGSGTPTAESSASTQSLLQRIQLLEARLDDRNSGHSGQHISSNFLAGTVAGEPDGTLPVRNMHHKTRLFGRSHWMNGSDLLPLLLRIFNRAMKNQNSALFRADLKCKSLSREIKAQRVPTLAFPLIQIGQAMCTRSIADSLVDCYLRTSESIHRVIHTPTFRAEYEQYWENPQASNPAFVILVQLCMAIGTCFYDEEFSMRSLAIRWIYEAELWLVLPSDATKMTFISLQIRCLLKIARQLSGLGADLTWISVGGLVRAAMYMGLHRDPQHSSVPKRTRLNSEMRRRLWATIMEINLQDSIDSGGSPLISMTDFDTEPPGNFDDEQLLEDGEDAVAANVPGTCTSTSIQIALLETFPIRLAVAKALNEFQSGLAHADVLRLSSQLATSIQSLQQKLQLLAKDDSAGRHVSGFQLRNMELLVQRFFLALHIPLLESSLDTPAYHFSRKVCLDTALKICQLSGLMPTAGRSAEVPTDFERLITSASGLRRTTVFQGIMIVAMELMSRKEEQRSRAFSVTLGDTELKSILEAALPWTKMSIKAGETNCKGYSALRAILAHVDALDSGLEADEVEKHIEAQAAEALLECYEFMKETDAGRAIESTAGTPSSHDVGIPALEDDPMGMGMFYDWEYLSHMMSPGMAFDAEGLS